ncbi:MAG: carboxypeptidase M32 [Desulfomonile tiedjei]|nr:carboxypeptidase M32 [Desulfomonile tiedjei]
MTPNEAYDRLSTRSKEIAYLSSATAVLHWDLRTTIPHKGHAHRAEQLSALAKIRHSMATDPEIGELLAVVEGTHLTRDPLAVEAVNIREWRRTYDRAVKIPQTLAVELVRAAAEGQTVWEQARREDDWNRFRPSLERIVALKVEEAQALGYEEEPYDALLEYYEQGETARNLESLFNRLRPPLVDLVQRIQDRGSREEPSVLHRHFPIRDQEAFATEVARHLGYDMDAGRLDVSAHPFTTGIGPGDVRITTRYSQDYFNEAFFAVIHEAGHAMYHQGLPLEHWGTPFCSPISLGINESQSRMWENMVARSEPFWRYFYPRAQARFASLADVPLDRFVDAVNEVSPNLIRVESDEVTYNLHIFLRFELEVLLCRRELSVKDLPEAWNARMKDYLGLTPPDFATGVMQDVHWSSGAIGYFPTYTLGNLYAAQFYRSAAHAFGDLDGAMTEGNFEGLRGWLREQIHSQGSRYRPRDLVKTVTSEDLNPQYLVEYLGRKYLGR